jgi:hypothetical protein
MRFGRNLGATLVVSAAALFVSAPAHATETMVCNEAQSSPRGTLVVTGSTDPSTPARHRDAAMLVGNGNGAGLVNAAAHSPALADCSPTPPPPPIEA